MLGLFERALRIVRKEPTCGPRIERISGGLFDGALRIVWKEPPRLRIVQEEPAPALDPIKERRILELRRLDEERDRNAYGATGWRRFFTPIPAEPTDLERRLACTHDKFGGVLP